MSVVNAYISVAGRVIPILLPTQVERDYARSLGIDEADLFRVDVPCGMTRWTRVTALVASTQVDNLFSGATVRLDLDDGSGGIVTLRNLYVRPPQPFLWRQAGGTVLIELVDERFFWQFTNAAQMNTALSPLWSSDGRWQVNDTSAPVPIVTYSDILMEVSTLASGLNLTPPIGFTVRTPEYVRRLSDLVGSPNATLAMVVDAVAAANTQVVVPNTIGGFVFIERSGLQAAYDKQMLTYLRAFCGGGQATNGTPGGADVLVNNWNQAGYQNRVPAAAQPVLPARSVEGKTVYDNVAAVNVPVGRVHFPYSQTFTSAAVPTWTRQPVDLGQAVLPESAVIVNDDTGATLLTCPGWDPTAFGSQVRDDYRDRYEHVPFGRTVWAGFVPWYLNSLEGIGQVGLVSYRLGMVDGIPSPVTVSEAREEDWRFGLQGVGENDPSKFVTAKGLAQSYRNCIGATIIDVPPPMTRVFPARITGSTSLGNWRWSYSFVEVEPNPTVSATLSVSTGSYARTGTLTARNMAENGNNLAGGLVAPGTTAAQYAGLATIAPLPISTDTIVMMCEQFPTAFVPEGCAPSGPQFWFSMPNAILVECVEP